MVKITLIRHAHCEYIADKTQPEAKTINAKLSPLGVEQAKGLNLNFDLLIISPLRRAMETYTNSNIRVSKIIVCKTFRELMSEPINFLDTEEIKLETEEELSIRIEEAIAFLKTLEGQYKNIGIISHWQFLRLFTRKVLGEEVKFKNAACLEINL
jgi:broad specificity phosphatase PhoE